MAVDGATGTAHPLAVRLWGDQDVALGSATSADFAEHALVTRDGATLALPMRPGRARASSFLRWTDAMSLPTVASRFAAWAAFRSGLAAPLLKERVGIRTVATDPTDPTLHEYLADVLHEPTVTIAGAWGPPRPNQKPVLRVFDASGATCGFAKVGWNQLTKTLVDTEASFLKTAPSLRTLRIPQLLHRGTWRGHTLSVTQPLLGRAPFRRPAPPGVAELEEVAGLSDRFLVTVAESTYRKSIDSRFPNGMPPEVRDALEIIDRRWGSTTLSWGHWHGDWTPWNMRRERNKLIVWDWERTAPGMPVGFDAIHYLFHSSLTRGQDAPEALIEAATATKPTLLRLGVPADAIGAVATLYALEMQLRFATNNGPQDGVAWLDSLLGETVRHFSGA